MAILSDDIVEAARQLQALRRQQSKLRQEEDKLRKQILLAMGEDTKGVSASGAPVAHVEIQHRRTIDRGRLEAMYPDIFDRVFEENMSAVLKIDVTPYVEAAL